MPDPEAWDVIVVGSGGAGLSAALRCAAGGLRTLIVERGPVVGGTTAMSGGGTWIPCNAHAAEAGLNDTPEAALAYIRATAPECWEREELPLWRAFLAAAPEMLAFVEDRTGLRFPLSDDPDPWPLATGAMPHGRMVSPAPASRRVPGFRLQPPHIPHLLTYHETRALDPWHHPFRAVLRLAPRLAFRLVTGRRAQGTALVAGLMRGFFAAGGTVRTGTRAIRLLRDAGAVTGLITRTGKTERTLHARFGVILASGGFERDAVRRAQHFRGPVDLVASAPGNTGDGHDMAEAVGAAMARMDQANIAPALPARLSGIDLPIGTFHHREPGAILVGPDGKRFVNEYAFNLGEILCEREADGRPAHLPCWMIADRATLTRAPVLRHFLRRRPEWAHHGQDATELAARIGLDAKVLAATLDRFSANAKAGTDPDFGRHLDSAGNPAPERLRPIASPLFALPFNLVFLSTKGGPRTDAAARVLDTCGDPIPGLYCAGVAMANPFGTRAPGSGTTIGPNLTWGWIAGGDILRRAAETKEHRHDQRT
ncbi:FAD-dependent oxidoreductase [Rhodobacterales bacterium HKCCE2091]|nr:FAD-dependent oxidoreductase [Rhodobacterales bacterium HKCCE2091]